MMEICDVELGRSHGGKYGNNNQSNYSIEEVVKPLLGIQRRALKKIQIIYLLVLP